MTAAIATTHTTPRARPRARMGLAGLFLMLAAVIGFRLLVGRDGTGALTFTIADGARLDLRSAAVVAGALAGASLGLAGLFLQVLLRNPLAAPSVLGVTSGAALGVSVTTLIGRAGTGAAASVLAATTGALGWSAELLGSGVGAVGALVTVYLLSRRRGGIDPMTLVLAGVVLSTLLGAMAMALQWALPPHSRADVSLWMMGRVPELLRWGVVVAAAVTLIVCFAAAARNSYAMDVSLAGDDEARSLGLRLQPLRRWLLVGAGLLSGCAVALCGPIAFVGFVAPHLARAMLGPRARWLVLGAPLCGAIVLVGADVARIVIPTTYGRLPVGVVTALVGGVWFLRLLSRGRESWT